VTGRKGCRWGRYSPSNQSADDTRSATVKRWWGKAGPQVGKWTVEIIFCYRGHAQHQPNSDPLPKLSTTQHSKKNIRGRICGKASEKGMPNSWALPIKKRKRCNMWKGRPWSLHGTQNIIYGAIIIAVAYSLNFKCNNNRKSYSSLHMTEMQIINPKTLALQCTWCQINIIAMLMCSDLCHNSCLLSDPAEWSRLGPT
jgi:hypothetical protein